VEEDLHWLRELNKTLWKPAEKPLRPSSPVAVQAQRQVDQDDLDRLCRCIEEHKLVTSMFSSNMFGGYGMHVYAPAVFPGVPLEMVFTIIEDNLPIPTRYDHINGTARNPARRTPGSGRDDAWEVFSKYTHSEQNRSWLRLYKMDPPRERSYYDY
jgi:hypothetical protein